jgi:HlyD family secretion protein
MKITLGRVLATLGILAALALVVWAFLPKPIPVETATVTKGKFVATVDEDGKTRIRERYVVAAPLTGHLTRVRLKTGDPVKADEVVATILPSPAPFLDPRARQEAEERLGTAEANRERTKAMVERARANAAQMQIDLDRTRTLKERGAATAQLLERAETAMRLADRELRAAEFLDHATEHEVAQTKALLAQYQNSKSGAPPERWNVTAPVSGFVLNVT